MSVWLKVWTLEANVVGEKSVSAAGHDISAIADEMVVADLAVAADACDLGEGGGGGEDEGEGGNGRNIGL